MSVNKQSTSVRTAGGGTLCTDIVNGVAEVKGVDPTDVEESLYHVVDPEALDRLYTEGNGRTTFVYAGCEVVVNSDGLVQVSETGGAAPAATNHSEIDSKQHIKANEDK